MDKVQQHIAMVREGLEKATLGPWSAYMNNDGGAQIVSESVVSGWIAQTWYKDEEVMENSESNARLIANSPTWLQQSIDMLEQRQKEQEDFYNDYAKLSNEYEKLDAAAAADYQRLLEANKVVEQQHGEIDKLQQVNFLYGAFIAELADNAAESIADQCRNVLKQGAGANKEQPTPIDYKARYKVIVEGLRDAIRDSKSVGEVLAWMESTTGFTMDDEHEEVSMDVQK